MRYPWALIVAAAIAAGQPVAHGVISGTVVEASNGSPIGKAIVTLTLQTTPKTWATARTDASGQFKFEELPPGKYELRAAKTGIGNAIYGADAAAEIGEFISLGEGETQTGLTLRFFHAGAIAGHVLDPDGDAVSGVQVTVLRASRNLGKRVLVTYRNGVTDDHGAFRVASLAPGDYYLQATPFNVRIAVDILSSGGVLTAQYFGGAREWKDSTVLHIRSGDNLANVDFHLSAEQLRRIHGHVTGVPDLGTSPPPDASEAGMMTTGPAGSVEVLLNLDDEGGTRWSQQTAAQAPDYQFDLGEIPGGLYRIEARFSSGKKVWAASEAFDSRIAGDDLALALSPAVDITGQLRIEGELEKPNPGFEVAISREGSREASLTGHVGPDGRFTLPQVTAGDWVMNIQKLPTGAFLKSVYFGDKDVRFAPISVPPGSNAPLNIVISTRSAKVEGEVAAGAGDSKRAGIMLAPTGKFHNLARFYYGAVSDDEGKFHFAHIAPGKYKIFALEKMAPLRFRNPEAADQLDELGMEIELTEGAILTVNPKLIPMARAREALSPGVPQ